jgi:hypothetical protein
MLKPPWAQSLIEHQGQPGHVTSAAEVLHAQGTLLSLQTITVILADARTSRVDACEACLAIPGPAC